MDTAVRRLHSLRVADVMTRLVVEVGCYQTMTEAARTMRRGQVTLVPVVDDQGCCVGVLSATDFLREHVELDGREPLSMQEHELVEELAVEGMAAESEPPIQIESRSVEDVTRYMNRNVCGVTADAPLLGAARVMDQHHLHRLVVLDDEHRPCGIISTMDVISAVLNALDEESLSTG